MMLTKWRKMLLMYALEVNRTGYIGLYCIMTFLQ